MQKEQQTPSSTSQEQNYRGMSISQLLNEVSDTSRRTPARKHTEYPPSVDLPVRSSNRFRRAG